MDERMKVLDLTFELGGNSFALNKAGFQVVSAVGNYQESEEIYKNNFGLEGFILKDLEEIPLNIFPDVDIIVGKLNYRVEKSIQGFNEDHINKKLCKIISKITPKAFIVEGSSLMLTSRSKQLKDFYEQLNDEYSLSHKILKESEYSGYPVVGKRLYVVGIRRDFFIENFYFPSPKYNEFSKVISQEEPNGIDSWYRKVNLKGKMEFDRENYYIMDRSRWIETSNIYFDLFREMYLKDAIGIRRLTHNELASVKGLKGYNFNECRNKYEMYRRIKRSCNVFVVAAIGEQVRRYLDDVVLSGKDKTEGMKNDNKPDEKTVLDKKLFPRHQILNIHIDKLKGIENLDLPIEKRLTAIMGVNGSGKSTVLHALACINMPFEDGEDYKFSYFFTPNPDANWKNSKFSITYYDEGLDKKVTRDYRKDKDRWSPRYANRPKRDTYFVGIESCIPEIEREKKTSFIDYSTNQEDDSISRRIIKKAAYILNKNYDILMSHETKNKKLFGVHTSDDITYSSLSMGAGEQRILKILDLLYAVNPYSLILIDEIDLLLHVTALRRLIETISEVAENKKLQVIFTTHSMEMDKLKKYVDIRYLESLPEKTMVYDAITPDIVYELTEHSNKAIEIYVEDLLAETIVRCIASDLNVLRNVKIVKYGAASNAFAIAASFAMQNKNADNSLIVLDGDVYRSKKEKNKAIKKVLTGTEKNYEEKVKRAESFISQFSLEEGVEPERFIFNMLVEMQCSDEIVEYAKKLRAVSNSHEWLDKIVDRMGQNEELILYRIMLIVSEHDKWEQYIHDVRQWLIDRRIELNK